MPERLANADDNVCFACGPENPMGRLGRAGRKRRSRRQTVVLRRSGDGDVVFTEPEPSKWWSSMPGVVNPGILLAVLGDSIVWAAEAFSGKTSLVDLPDSLDGRFGDG